VAQTYPADLALLTNQLADAYGRAWSHVVAEQQRIAQGLALNPRLWRQRDRLAEVRQRIELEMTNVDALAAHWTSREFPRYYMAGAEEAATRLASPFQWTQTHREAVTLLAKDAFDDLLEATTHVREDTKRFLREVIRPAVMTDQLAGKTAKQTARNVTRYLQARGIHAVKYANGARVGLATYAEMAVRTKTAVAYNVGTFNQGAEFGVKFYEVFDGGSCGWTSHNDVDLANGSIRSAEEAATFTIAHPNCARSFGPRPDLATKTEAKKAEPTAGGQAKDRPEAAQFPLEAAARTGAARQAAGARRSAAGLVGRVRTPQRVLERRAAMLQRVRLPRAPRGPGRPADVPPPPPAPTPPTAAGWRDELDQLLTDRPNFVTGQEAVDVFGDPNAASYAQEAWVRSVGEVVDREVLRRADDFAARLRVDIDVDALKAEWDRLVMERLALPSGAWDEVAQQLYGKGWAELTTTAERSRVVEQAKLVGKERTAIRARELAAKAKYEGVKDLDAIAYRQAARDVLGEVRVMGTGAKDSWRWMDPKVTGKKMGAKYGEAKQTLDAASEFFPQDWIDRANAARSIRTGSIQRGHQLDHARQGYTDVMLSPGREGALLAKDPDMLSVATHELGHLMETVDPRVRSLEHAFHHRRTTDFAADRGTVTDRATGAKIPGRAPQEATSRIYGGPKEVGRKDKWSEHYMGKVYRFTGNGATDPWEHLSMGMEGIWAGRWNMVSKVDGDADYRHWMLGLLAGI
jgi:hypothetical protein